MALQDSRRLWRVNAMRYGLCRASQGRMLGVSIKRRYRRRYSCFAELRYCGPRASRLDAASTCTVTGQPAAASSIGVSSLKAAPLGRFWHADTRLLRISQARAGFYQDSSNGYRSDTGSRTKARNIPGYSPASIFFARQKNDCDVLPSPN